MLCNEDPCFLTTPAASMYCQTCKPPKQLVVAVQTERWRIFCGRSCWAGLRVWTIPVKPHFWLCLLDMPCAVCWEFQSQILLFCSWAAPIRFTTSSCQREQGLKEASHSPLACLMFVLHCSVSSLALAQVLTPSQSEWDWDSNQIKTNFFFIFPFWINFKSRLLFYPIHQVPAQTPLPAQSRGQLRWGNGWPWAVQEKRQRDISVARQLLLC